MKATEIRVGNWAKSPYQKEPFRINASHIMDLDGGMDECAIEGILLAPTLFATVPTEKNIKHGFIIQGIHIRYITNEEHFIFEFEMPNSKSVTTIFKYVHEFQNLYYPLFKKELEISL